MEAFAGNECIVSYLGELGWGMLEEVRGFRSVGEAVVRVSIGWDVGRKLEIVSLLDVFGGK